MPCPCCEGEDSALFSAGRGEPSTTIRSWSLASAPEKIKYPTPSLSFVMMAFQNYFPNFIPGPPLTTTPTSTSHF